MSDRETRALERRAVADPSDASAFERARAARARAGISEELAEAIREERRLREDWIEDLANPWARARYYAARYSAWRLSLDEEARARVDVAPRLARLELDARPSSSSQLASTQRSAPFLNPPRSASP